MIEPFTIARMLQRFIVKKKSVGYSHPPILRGKTAVFNLLDNHGNKFEVSVREISLDEEIVEARSSMTGDDTIVAC